MANHVDGSCLCGRTRFRITFPTRFFSHCHCRSCRLAFGAPVVTWAGVPSEQFQWLAGGDSVGRYASSPGVERTFCPTCGTSLTFTSPAWAGETHVAAATLQGELDRPIGGHAFYDEHVPWLAVADPPSNVD